MFSSGHWGGWPSSHCHCAGMSFLYCPSAAGPSPSAHHVTWSERGCSWLCSLAFQQTVSRLCEGVVGRYQHYITYPVLKLVPEQATQAGSSSFPCDGGCFASVAASCHLKGRRLLSGVDVLMLTNAAAVPECPYTALLNDCSLAGALIPTRCILPQCQ